METDIEKTEANGLDMDSLMRCSRAIRALFNDDLPDELAKKIRVWLFENCRRPEVDHVLRNIFYEFMDGENEKPSISISVRLPMLDETH